MPFSVHLCNPCLLPADSSIISSVPPRSSSSKKSILRRHFFKKRSIVVQDQHQQLSTRKFQRIKGSNIVREVKSKSKSRSISKSMNNYDMTILHDDELENTQLAKLRRRKKRIPSWANKDQLQLAIINQVYFQDQNPEDIFGSICIEHAFDMIKTIDIKNKESISMIVSRHFV